jgi:radical SAM superfamily enzyme YgiQ (UPF0313 family)
MKILLVYPSYTEIYGKYKPAAKIGVLYPPLGLLYLASVLENGGHDVKIVNMEADGVDMDGLKSIIRGFSPDIVGTSSMTPLFKKAIEIIALVKSVDKDIITLMGGPHVTSLPEESMELSKETDIIVYGEAELTILEVVKALERGDSLSGIRGIIYRKGGDVRKNPPRDLIKDLDTIPFPARHLIDQDRYIWSVPRRGIMPITSFMTTRGCPFQCVFCSQRVIFGRSVRHRSNHNSIEEIKEIYHEHRIKHLVFDDDTLGINKDRAIEFCDMLIAEKMDLTWEGMTRVNVVSRELLLKMKEAGLNRLSYGVESGNQDILDLIKKGTNLDQIRRAYKLADSVGLETRMSVIIGLPGETRQTVMDTIKFMKSLKCDQAYVNIATPFPGTEFYEMAKRGEHGLSLLTDDWSEYRRWGNAVINVNDLTRNDLIKLQKKALMGFYLRPKQTVYNIRRAGPGAAIKNVAGFAKSFIRR